MGFRLRFKALFYIASSLICSATARADCFKDPDSCDAPAHRQFEQERDEQQAEEKRASAAEKQLKDRTESERRAAWRRQIDAMPASDHAETVIPVKHTQGLALKRTAQGLVWSSTSFSQCQQLFVFNPASIAATKRFGGAAQIQLMMEMQPYLGKLPEGFVALYSNPGTLFSAIKKSDIIPSSALIESGICRY